MFLAASTRCFAELPLIDACRQINDLEYDMVEIHLDENIPGLEVVNFTQSTDQFLLQMRESTRLTPVSFDLATHVPEDVFTKLCKIAKLNKMMQITLPSSPLGTPYNEEVDRLKMYILVASRDGIRISIRTTTGCLTEDPRTAVELCQNIKGLGLTLDPSHYTTRSPGPMDFDIVYPYVYHVHLRDSSATELQVPVGLGEVDYNKIIASLRKEEYNRVLSIDLSKGKMNDAERGLEMRKMRMLIDSLL